MRVNVIYTFSDSPQQFVDIEITKAILNNKSMFFLRLTSCLSDIEKETLCKISCCIYADIKISESHWYSKENGKFFDDVIPGLIFKLYGIKCTYEPVNK